MTGANTYTYDSNGLLTASTQPGDKTFAYTYDAYGNLTGVDGAGGAVKWNLTGYTGRRTISETVLDNNTSYPFVKTHLLDPFGYLDSIYTVQDDCWYQEDDYNFSALTGNLLSMKQNWMDYPQTFGYDNLDRLTSVSENNESIMNMVYATNGNITSKTGVGSYTYNSSVKPHAVQSVSNTDGLVELEEQDITYNLWGKVSSIWCYDENDFYSYSVEYGPDLERVSTRLDKTYHIEYEKFLWGDYEEKTTDGVTTCFYFVNGTDGLAGLHTVSSTQGGTVTHTAAVMTDHLGSITTMADNLDWCYDAHYDVWGNREVQLPFYYSIERGYTGHEQPEGLRLIDMRGRMYDPVLGRFISPDAFIQSPTDPQNYNRYSYCLNNPLKYTDPDGELFWEAVLIGAAIFGTGNTIAHGIRGDINGLEDGILYFAQGALAGAALGATWYLAPSIPVVGNAIQSYMTWTFDCKLTLTALSAASGVARGITTGDWKTLLNSAEIFLGNFYIDENLGFWEGIWNGYSKQSWESLQMGLGHTVGQLTNMFNCVERVEYYGGATVLKYNSNDMTSFSLGCFIHGNNKIEANPSNSLFQHEFGHYLQSRLSGIGFLFAFGIESGFSDWFANDHRLTYTEIDANRRALKYFSNQYVNYGWIDEEGYYHSSNWKWQDNPLERTSKNGKFKDKYLF